MSATITPPPSVPPGWQRQQDVLARLADIGTEIVEARGLLKPLNDELRELVEQLLDVASVLISVHGSEPGGDLAEALAGLQSATRALRVPASDPDMGVTSTLKDLRAVQGRLRSAVDDALDAVQAAGRSPAPIARQPEAAATLPVRAMLQRLQAVTQRLQELAAAKDERPQVAQQAGLVTDYVEEMQVEVDLARLHLTIGGTTLDLGALSRAAESMAGLTEEFVATVRAMAARLSETVVRVAEQTLQRVLRVTGGTAKLESIVLGLAARRQPLPGSVMRDGPDLPEMVLIPPGRFLMGTPPEEDAREKVPEEFARRSKRQHEVTLRRGFWLGKYPVTRAEFAAFVADKGYVQAGGAQGWVEAKRSWEHSEQFGWNNPGFPQTDRDPVVCVSAADAEAYVQWLSGRTGRRYRLPSEAEWEYAARANTTTARFWGDDRDGARRYANIADRSLSKRMGEKFNRERFFPWDDGYPFTSPVGSFQSNPFGLCDMLGNVWEWVADDWHDDYEGAPDDGLPWTTTGSAGPRVLRGGSWYDGPRGVRAGYRFRYVPGDRNDDVGFRLARTL